MQVENSTTARECQPTTVPRFPVLLASDALSKQNDIDRLLTTYRQTHRAGVDEALDNFARLRRGNPDVTVNGLHHAIAEVSRVRALEAVMDAAGKMIEEVWPGHGEPRPDAEAVLREAD